MKRKSLLFLLLFALIAPWAANAQTTITLTGDLTQAIVPGTTYTFYDSGGPDANYGTSETYTATFTCNGEITINFSQFATESSSGCSNWDYMLIYDGTTLLGRGQTGCSSNFVTTGTDIVAESGTLIIEWHSDSSVTGAGWTATITGTAASSCTKPTNVAVSYEGSIATATWEGEASLYNIDVNGTVTNGVSSPYTFAIEPQTTYSVKVQADCGGGDLSGWAYAPNFTTPCAAYALPYAYGFENASDMECWSMVDCAASTGRTTTASYVHEGSAAFCFVYNTNPPQYLISPMFEGTGNGLSVSFYYMNPSSSYTETFQVGYSTTTNATSAFTWGTEITASNANANTWFIYENDFPAGTKYVAVKLNSYDQLRLCLDDFTFEAPSSCRKPTDLAAGEVGKRSATIRWTENGVATAWQVEVTDLDGGQVTTWNANATSFEIVGLTPGTRYSVRVNPVCDVEKWSDAITFTTEVACPAPELTIVESTPLATTFSWTGDAQGYEMEYMINPSFTFEDGTLQGWTNLIVNADGGQWLHSNDNPGGYIDPSATDNPYYPDLAHNGTGFAMCYSYIDYVGSYNTDAYLVSPRSYLINNGASMNFWYDMANDTYPEYFEVCVATAANPTADDFTAIWTSDAKGSNGQKAAVRHRNHTRYQNWREVTIDLSAYVGQTIWIAFHDVNEDMYEVWIDDVMINDGTIDWTPAPAPIVSPYTLALEPGTEYLVRVRAICGGEDGESAWTTVTVTTPSNCDAPTALNVTNLMPTTATLNWTGYQDGYQVRYRTAASVETFFFEGFEGLDQELPEGWTSIDADGDGNGWYGLTGFGDYAHSGDGIVTSASYAGSALTPDNWLVTPQIALKGTMKVYLRAQDPSWTGEHYAIYLSTTGNTVDDFTTTLVEESSDLTGEYLEITADLSSYNGQLGYIAIRHFNCTDMFRINVDDFGIYGGEVPAGEWNTVTTGDLFADIIELHPETAYEWQVCGENRSCTNGEEEGYTAWSEMGTFTTPGLCDPLATLLIDELTATSITLSWTGYQESYNVQYRTAEIIEEYFYDWFEEDLSNWTEDNTSADNYATQVTSSGIYGYIFFVDEEVSGAQTLISTEMEPTTSGTILDFYTASEGNSSYKIGFSSTDNALASFSWSEELTCDGDGYFHEYQGEVPEGTKYFAIQFVSNDNEEGYLIITGFEVSNLVAEAGEWITFEGVNSPYTISGLTPKTEYEVYVQGVCGEDETTDWLGGYFTTPELTTITQTTNLNAGWNWFSAYVEGNAVTLLQAIENGLGDKGITIKGSEISTDYYGEEYGWFGELDALGIVNEQMYLINVTESCTIELQGTPANPANHAITINPGWNWIGFPCAEAVSVAAALAGFPAEEGDVLKGSELSTDYYGEEFGWFGGLETLEPGQGYLYKYNGTTAQTLIFKTSAKRAATTNTLLLKKQIKDQKHNAISRKTMSTKNGVVYEKFKVKK